MIGKKSFFEISVWYDKENYEHYERERRSIIVECGGLEVWKKTLILQHLANY